MSAVPERIHLCLANIGDAEERYIHDAISKNWVTSLGPEVDRFENLLTRYLQSPANSVSESYVGKEILQSDRNLSVLCVSSGTAALHLALLLLGVGSGDEVLCQSWTFAASVNPVCYVGAKPVFVDSDSLTWNIDPDLLKSAIEDRIKITGHPPKAMIIVDLYGMPAQWNKIRRIAREYGIPIVEDSAEALGSCYDGSLCGTFGDFGILSFNGNKMITTGAGGALICRNRSVRDKALYYATQAKQRLPYYEHTEIGYNYRLSNISAAIGCGQMEMLESHLRHHRMLCELYDRELRGIPGLSVHRNPSGKYDSNYWLTTVLFDNNESSDVTCIDRLMKYLDANNIESRRLWKPMHLQPVYKDCPAYLNGVSGRLWGVGLCLPSGPKVTAGDAVKVCRCIKEFFEKR